MTGAPQEQRVRLALADDDAMVRAGVAAVLSSDPTIEVVGEAVDGRAAVELVRRHRPDVVLLDIRMPGLDGLAALPAVLDACPDTAVMMLTTFSEGDYVARAISGGARGFVLKAGAPRELILGVHSVAEGGAFFSPSVARWLVENTGYAHTTARTRARRALDGLSPRHTDVLALLAAGSSNAQIARKLHLAEGTVRIYVSAILDQLGVANRVQAAILAHEAGVGRDPEPGT